MKVLALNFPNRGDLPAFFLSAIMFGLSFRLRVPKGARGFAVFAVVMGLAFSACEAADWKLGAPRLTTAWTADVRPETVLPDYPRPQMERKDWLNLNGLWDYAIRPVSTTGAPPKWDGRILVPFPVESYLSQVMRQVGKTQMLWYRTVFTLPPGLGEKHVLLNFGAVDWRTTVFVNGQEIGQHEGGFTPFSFDITSALRASGEQELVVRVWDPTDGGSQPRGKQSTKPAGIWYSAVTGIWQTVWLEWVPANAISTVKITPDVDGQKATFVVETKDSEKVDLSIQANGKTIATASGKTNEPIDVLLANPELWSPDHPFLYDVTIRCGEDELTSYFGMRKVEIKTDEQGFQRVFLNNHPLFQLGLLDQGYWPDGLYTAPSEDALKWDIDTVKKLGFNMVRKHQKVEPDRWYYWADRLGLMVWQDQPCAMQRGTSQLVGRGQDQDGDLGAQAEEVFRTELREMIDTLQAHPSVVAWIPFNEGWGQHDTNSILKWVKEYDPSRIIDGPSGWNDLGYGDVFDIHGISSDGTVPLKDGRATMVGEFGSIGCPVPDHEWGDRSWGFDHVDSVRELPWAYEGSIGRISQLIPRGLAGAVYTQFTDVENEVTGLVSYDRKVIKLPIEEIAAVNRGVIEGNFKMEMVPFDGVSELRPKVWRYTVERPADDWMSASFDDKKWKRGAGGFGQDGTPGAIVKTVWNSSDIWLRREFELKNLDLREPYFRVHHDEDAEIYVNGTLALTLPGFTDHYLEIPLDERTKSLLVTGKNVIAVHCRQTTLGQNIDVGLLDRKLQK